MNTKTKSTLCARSLGGSVNSRHWLLTRWCCLPPCKIFLYCQIRRRLPQTNHAQPSGDIFTLTAVLPKTVQTIIKNLSTPRIPEPHGKKSTQVRLTQERQHFYQKMKRSPEERNTKTYLIYFYDHRCLSQSEESKCTRVSYLIVANMLWQCREM